MNDTTTAPGDQPSRAADGGHVPGACNTLGEFIRSLEDGQFDADCYEDLKDLKADLNEFAFRNGGIAKGKCVITLDFKQDGGITEIKAKFKMTSPEPNRSKSVMWGTEDNRFTRTQPGQQQLFGIRDATAGHAGYRDA